MNNKNPIGFLICSGIVFIASFMPWGSFATSTGNMFNSAFGSNSPFGNSGFHGSPFGNTQMSISINGWNGNCTLLGVIIPNWILVVIAISISLFAFLKAKEIWEAHSSVNVLLSVYGIIHVGTVFLIFLSKGSIGIGSIATIGAFIGFLLLSFKALQATKNNKS